MAHLAEASLVVAPQPPVELDSAGLVQVEVLASAVLTPVEGCSAVNPPEALGQLAPLEALARAADLGLELRPGPGLPLAGQDLLFSNPFHHPMAPAAHRSTQ